MQIGLRFAVAFTAILLPVTAAETTGYVSAPLVAYARNGNEVRPVLGIPGDVATYALMPIGYPEGNFGPVARRAVSEVVYADRWANPWPASAAARAR